jgi:hypothetical protein
MPEVFTLDLIDEFAYELTPLIVPATRGALARIVDLALVQDASCEYVVTLSGDRLILWNPQVHMADQATRRVRGELEDALAAAVAWLATYMDVDADTLEVLLEPTAFH